MYKSRALEGERGPGGGGGASSAGAGVRDPLTAPMYIADLKRRIKEQEEIKQAKKQGKKGAAQGAPQGGGAAMDEDEAGGGAPQLHSLEGRQVWIQYPDTKSTLPDALLNRTKAVIGPAVAGAPKSHWLWGPAPMPGWTDKAELKFGGLAVADGGEICTWKFMGSKTKKMVLPEGGWDSLIKMYENQAE